MKKELEKTDNNSLLQCLDSSFPANNNISPQRLGTAFQKFVDEYRSYNRAK